MKKIIYGISGLLMFILIAGIMLAVIPMSYKLDKERISPDDIIKLRNDYAGSHYLVETSDGETLFLRYWQPDSVETANKDLAVLICHGLTAYGGAYATAADIISSRGYPTFAIDYRGHGLSGGIRGDYTGKDRWIKDLTETVFYIKSLGFGRVIIMGHSLGVGAAIYAAKAIPGEIAGLILLSGAYQGREGVRKPPTLLQKAKILARSVIWPSRPVVEYYRDGMTGTGDPLFNFRYTLRFLTMLKMEELRLPDTLDIPVLVAVGDKDELFEVAKVEELFTDVPGHKKEFMVLKDTYHARFPDESWEILATWLDKNT